MVVVVGVRGGGGGIQSKKLITGKGMRAEWGQALLGLLYSTCPPTMGGGRGGLKELVRLGRQKNKRNGTGERIGAEEKVKRWGKEKEDVLMKPGNQAEKD